MTAVGDPGSLPPPAEPSLPRRVACAAARAAAAPAATWLSQRCRRRRRRKEAPLVVGQGLPGPWVSSGGCCPGCSRSSPRAVSILRAAVEPLVAALDRANIQFWTGHSCGSI